jgi:glycosyltransferase involved in cell wall biosynthesis
VWRARTVLTVHDLSFMHYPECSSPPLLRYLMAAVPRSVRRADAILADSESTRRDVIELLGVPAEQVFVIYPGAEPRFTPGPADDAETAAVLARYGIQRPYILSVGTLQPRKNYVRLIQAYAALRQEQRLPQERHRGPPRLANGRDRCPIEAAGAAAPCVVWLCCRRRSAAL